MNQLLIRAWVFVVIMCAFSPALMADQLSKKAAELFFGICYHPIDSISRIESIAMSLGWKTAPDDMKKANAPADAIGYKMWVLNQPGGPVFVSINKGKMADGSAVNVCSLVLNLSLEEILPELKKEIKLKFISSEKEPFQTYTSYQVPHPLIKRALISILHGKPGQKPINIIMQGIKD